MDAEAVRADLRNVAAALVRLRLRLLKERAATQGSYALDMLLDQTAAMTDLLADAVETAWSEEDVRGLFLALEALDATA